LYKWEKLHCLIVPHPGDGQLYYIFKTNQEHNGIDPKGLHYSIVDISGAAGLGEVILKEYNFIPTTSPMLTVTLGADEKSYWIITHGWEDNVFYSTKLTESGISVPVSSMIGDVYGDKFVFRDQQLKISPDGTKLAVTQAGGYVDESYRGGFVHLYDFNSKTGVVSNFRNLDVWSTGGVEFSPNSELLYVSAISQNPAAHLPGIAQLDISSGITETINNSQTPIAGEIFIEVGELQLGPDGRIYGGDNLGAGQIDAYPCVIQNPNIVGLGCGFIDDGLILSSWGSPLRLPLTVQSIFRESPSVPTVKGCKDIETQVRVTSLGYADSLQWDFGDGSFESFGGSTGKIVNHTYSNTGSYDLKVKKYIGTLSRMIESKVTIVEKPVVDLGRDTILCKDDELLLDAMNDGMTFIWSTGEVSQKIVVTNTNQYEVTVNNGGCTSSDNIDVQVYEYPEIDLGPDQTVCDGVSIVLSVPPNSDHTFLWSTGSHQPEIEITESGIYSVEASHGRYF